MNSVVYCCVADIQTPDFSNVVMESLDRVGQIEGSQLVADGDPVQQQQQPFPVMLHANPSIPTPVVPVTAVSAQVPPTDVQATPSTSGGRCHRLCLCLFHPLVAVHQTFQLLIYIYIPSLILLHLFIF